MPRKARVARWGVVVLLVGLLGALSAAQAGTVSLAWDTAANADGYRVYYGTTPGQYAFNTDVGNRTNTTISGLADCTTWYFAIKAYNASGESADFSNEVAGWPRPLFNGPAPLVEMQGSQVTVTISGANFQSGLTVATDNPNVFLGPPTVNGCDQVQVVATVEPLAPGVRPAEIGNWMLEIVNPDNVFGARADGVQVQVNPSRFDIVDDQGASNERLDGRDTILLSRLFGSREGDSLYDPDSDFNGDGWVDGQDLAYLASNLGLCWDVGAWGWNLPACPPELR